MQFLPSLTILANYGMNKDVVELLLRKDEAANSSERVKKDFKTRNSSKKEIRV